MALELQAAWMADELSSRLIPALGDEADFVAFDRSDVVAHQEDEAEKWRRAKEQIESGVMLRRHHRRSPALPRPARPAR
jgi:hypothetical protein